MTRIKPDEPEAENDADTRPGPAFGEQTDANSFLEPVLTSDWFRYLPDAHDNPAAAADRAFGPEALKADT